MRRSLGYLSFALAAGLALTAWGIRRVGLPALDPGPTAVVVSVLQVGAILAGAYGLYLLTSRVLVGQTPDKRRQHDVRNGLRFCSSRLPSSPRSASSRTSGSASSCR